MYFIDWLFVIAVLIAAVYFLEPELTALTSGVAAVIQSLLGF